MTRKEFKDLCYKYQGFKNSYFETCEEFDVYGLLSELERNGIEFDTLESHDSLKDWFKHCIEEEYNVGPQITQWFKEGFADYYQVDLSMGTMARITALATAEDFYEAFEDYSCFVDDPQEDEEEDE